MKIDSINFWNKKPIIAMVHLGALPGSPLYNKEIGITGLIKEAKKDLEAPQTAKFDAIMFGNENDRLSTDCGHRINCCCIYYW